MSLRTSLEKETVVSADSEQQILDILDRCKTPLKNAKKDSRILFTDLGSELQSFEDYLRDIDRDTIVNEFEYIFKKLAFFIHQLVNYDEESCRQLQEQYRQLSSFYKECFAKATLTDIIKLYERHANAIQRDIVITLARFSNKDYQELKKYLEVHFDVNIPEGEASKIAQCLYSILADPEKTAAILDRFDKEDKDNDARIQDIKYMLQLSSSLKTKIREIVKLKQYHANLHNILKNLYSCEVNSIYDDASIHEFAFMHSSEQIQKFSQELITNLNLLVPDHVKKLFIDDLLRYEQYLQSAKEKKSSSSGFLNFFSKKPVKSSPLVELKAIEKLKESLKGQDVEFTSLETEALNRGPLGAIVEKYKQAGALPKDFFNRESFQKGPTRIMASTNTESS